MKRFILPILAVVLFAAAILVFGLDRPLYLRLLGAIGEHPLAHPFVDTRFVTAQVECWARGVDVYARNPCDPLGRTQDYSPLWLQLPFLAVGDRATVPLGLAGCALFLAALFAIPWRGGGRLGLLVCPPALFSWSTAFALERGNTDLAIFALAVLFARLLDRAPAARAAGYAIVLGAGLLKFYPLPLLVFAARERPRHAVPILAAAALALAAFYAAFHAELARIGANMASGAFGGMFGARSLPDGLRELARVTGALRPPVASALSALLFATLLAACLLRAWRWGSDPGFAAALRRLPRPMRSLLGVGAVLTLGCFFAHQNIGYRATVLLLPLPGLLLLARLVADRPQRRALQAAAVAVAAALWSGDIDRTPFGWLAVHLAWWWIASVLLAIAAAEAWMELRRVPAGAFAPRRGAAAATVPP